ncbi:hypothetical protein MKX07_001021 [Trichoderma sp. CBMAI-0711]|nr:hypothetical protein MKX07_001021 [Trichoderma sp. CBMAI-0711]
MDGVDSVFANFQSWQVRQEVITDEAAHEDPIVNGPLQIKPEGKVGNGQLNGEILPQNRDVQPNKGLQGGLHGLGLLIALGHIVGLCGSATVVCLVPFLATELTSPILAFVEEDIFAQNSEVRFVRGESQHDEIGIQAIDDVAGVGIVVWGGALGSDEGHDFMFTFARHGSIRDDDLELSPGGIRVELILAPVPQTHGEDVHEWRARGDGVGIECLLDNSFGVCSFEDAAILALEQLDERLLVLFLFLGFPS